MELKTAPLSLTATDGHGHRHGTHLRRRAAGAAAFDGAADAGGRLDAADAQHPPERAAPQRGDGHGHRVGAGHRDGAARRPRRHPQEPVDSRAGGRGRSRQAVRERHDRQPDHALAVEPDLRSARPDEELPDLGRADHRGRQQGRAAGRHPHQPRPALRDQRQSADRRGDDEGPALHGAGRHDARRGARVPPPAQGRKAAGRRQGLPAEGADHRQGHPEGRSSTRTRARTRSAGCAAARRSAWPRTRSSGRRRSSRPASTCSSSIPRMAIRRA